MTGNVSPIAPEPATAAEETPAERRKLRDFGAIWKKYGTFGILVLLIVISAIVSPQFFLTKDNLLQVLVQSAALILLACGEFFTILIAGIDLSVGAVLGLVGMIVAKLLVAGVPLWLALVLGLAVGGLIGGINGLLVNVTRLHPFIITLGTAAIFRGVTLIISNASSVFGFTQTFEAIVAGRVVGIPIPILIAAAVAGFLYFVTQFTVLGRNIYAIGGNAQAALFSGIDVRLNTLVVFVISGACAGVAGIVTTARTGAAEPNAGVGFETFAIASAIIGGTSFFGGRGRISGVVVGALIIGVISNVLNIANVQSYYQQIVMGTLIIVAVTIDRFFSTRT